LGKKKRHHQNAKQKSSNSPQKEPPTSPSTRCTDSDEAVSKEGATYDKPNATRNQPRMSRMSPWQFLKKPEHASAVAAIFAAVIGIATIVYTVATIIYTRTSARQFEATQRALQQDRRAYVVLNVDSPSDPIKPNEPVVIGYTLTDKGKTPAKNVIAEVVIKLMPNDGVTVPQFDYSEPHLKSSFPLMQSDDPEKGKIPWVHDLTMTPELPSQSVIDDLAAGKTYTIVYAKVTYLDIYGVEHWQHLCRWRSYTTANIGFSSRPCVDYNDVDNN
jgi:hypothetical protein